MGNPLLTERNLTIEELSRLSGLGLVDIPPESLEQQNELMDRNFELECQIENYSLWYQNEKEESERLQGLIERLKAVLSDYVPDVDAWDEPPNDRNLVGLRLGS